MGRQQLLGVGGSVGGGGSGLLAAGPYWQTGIVSAPPTAGQGWTSGLPSGGAGKLVTLLHVNATSFVLGSWVVGAKWDGAVTAVYAEWGGASYSAITDLTVPGWSNNLGYQTGSHTATFLSIASAQAYILQFTESGTGGAAQITSSTLS